MSRVVNILKPGELADFRAWAEQNGYEYDDCIFIKADVFRLTKPGAPDVLFYDIPHLGCFAAYSDAGIGLLSEWRNAAFDFLL